MKPGQRLLFAIMISIILWAADSLILSLFSPWGFFAALWLAVPKWRLFTRLIIVLLLLLSSSSRYISYSLRRMEIVRMNKQDDGTLFGEEESGQRSKRMLYYAMRLATVLELRPRERDKLRLLCYCHDIGMAMIPEDLVARKGQLSREEQALFNTHAAIGAQIAASIPQLAKAAPLVACHEERYNGSGPKSLFGRSIPLACRIFTAVEMLDELMNCREEKMSKSAALDELQLYAGTSLDPDVVKALQDMLLDKRIFKRVSEQVFATP